MENESTNQPLPPGGGQDSQANPSQIATTNPGDLFKDTRTFDNLNQCVIRITEDKVRLILREFVDSHDSAKAWIAPAGLSLSLSATIVTTSFKDALGLTASTWQAFFLIATVLSILWLIVAVWKAVYRRFFTRTVCIDKCIDQMKNVPSASIPAQLPEKPQSGSVGQ